LVSKGSARAWSFDVLFQKKSANLFLVVSGELEDNLLSGQAAVDGAESIELVLQGGRVLGIKETINEPPKKRYAKSGFCC